MVPTVECLLITPIDTLDQQHSIDISADGRLVVDKFWIVALLLVWDSHHAAGYQPTT